MFGFIWNIRCDPGSSSGRAHIERGRLREIEDLEAVDLRPVNSASVAVPTLTATRRCPPVIPRVSEIHEVPAEQRPKDSGQAWVQDDAFDVPLLVDQSIASVLAAVLVTELHHALIHILWNNAVHHEVTVLTEFQDFMIIHRRIAVELRGGEHAWDPS